MAALPMGVHLPLEPALAMPSRTTSAVKFIACRHSCTPKAAFGSLLPTMMHALTLNECHMPFRKSQLYKSSWDNPRLTCSSCQAYPAAHLLGLKMALRQCHKMLQEITDASTSVGLLHYTRQE